MKRKLKQNETEKNIYGELSKVKLKSSLNAGSDNTGWHVELDECVKQATSGMRCTS